MSNPALVLIGVGAAVLCGLAVAVAGPLDPPSGPPTPTFKTLDEVEPRTAINTLAGDGVSTHLITQPGSYYLTNSILGEAGKSGIKVVVSNVTIDLNGFSLQGVPGSLDGIETGSIFSPVTNIVVRGGVVRDWDRTGVSVEQASNVLVESVTASNNGLDGIRAGASVSPPNGNVIRNCVATQNDGNGISVDNGVVESCAANNNVGRGINAQSSTVSNSTATGNEGDGIGGSGSLSHSTAITNRQDGIRWSGTITGCRSSNNLGDGIEARVGSVVTASTASFNGLNGILLEDGAIARHCVARENGGDGFELEDASTVTGSTAIANTGFGINAIGEGPLIDGNHVAKNGGGIQTLGTEATVIRNVVSGPNSFPLSPTTSRGPVAPGGGILIGVGPYDNIAN